MVFDDVDSNPSPHLVITRMEATARQTADSKAERESRGSGGTETFDRADGKVMLDCQKEQSGNTDGLKILSDKTADFETGVMLDRADAVRGDEGDSHEARDSGPNAPAPSSPLPIFELSPFNGFPPMHLAEHILSFNRLAAPDSADELDVDIHRFLPRDIVFDELEICHPSPLPQGLLEQDD